DDTLFRYIPRLILKLFVIAWAVSEQTETAWGIPLFCISLRSTLPKVETKSAALARNSSLIVSGTCVCFSLEHDIMIKSSNNKRKTYLYIFIALAIVKLIK